MFGISIPQSLQECAAFIRGIDTFVLPCLELQGDLISEGKIIEAAKAKNFYFISSYDYIKNSTIINSLDQHECFQDEVILTIDSLLNNTAYLPISNVTIDFGIFREPHSVKIHRFMQSLYYRIMQSNKNICLPINIPGMEDNLSVILKAFYKLMLGKFKICLNLYPHEVKRTDDFSCFINDLSFRIDFIRICYDAISGNYITDKLLGHWKKVFEKCSLNCPMIFVPSVNSMEMLEKETLRLCELIKRT